MRKVCIKRLISLIILDRRLYETHDNCLALSIYLTHEKLALSIEVTYILDRNILISFIN